MELDVETARWLVSSSGLEVVAAVTARLRKGETELSIATHVAKDGLGPARVAAAIDAGHARLRAKDRGFQADLMLFTRDALEQASTPEVASWRAGRFAGQEVWDLCAGSGGDAMAIATLASSLTAVELEPGRSVLLMHNLSVLGLEATVVTGDALTVEPPSDAVVHADPSRRRDGRRVRRLAAYVPPVPTLMARHGEVRGLGVVLSPGLDHADPDLPGDVEVEYIQLGRGLAEAVAWRGDLRTPRVTATATLLPSGAQRSRVGPRGARLPVGDVGSHLLEVAPAAVRARLHDDIGGEADARRIASRRALLTTDDAPPPSPWFRARPVLSVLSARPKRIRSWLRAADPGPVELVLHGVDADPDRWWHEIGRPPRGPGGIRLEMIRLDRGTVVVATDAGDDHRPQGSSS